MLQFLSWVFHRFLLVLDGTSIQEMTVILFVFIGCVCQHADGLTGNEVVLQVHGHGILIFNFLHALIYYCGFIPNLFMPALHSHTIPLISTGSVVCTFVTE